MKMVMPLVLVRKDCANGETFEWELQVGGVDSRLAAGSNLSGRVLARAWLGDDIDAALRKLLSDVLAGRPHP